MTFLIYVCWKLEGLLSADALDLPFIKTLIIVRDKILMWEVPSSLHADQILKSEITKSTWCKSEKARKCTIQSTILAIYAEHKYQFLLQI